jgi:hypothetical protein
MDALKQVDLSATFEQAKERLLVDWHNKDYDQAYM